MAGGTSMVPVVYTVGFLVNLGLPLVHQEDCDEKHVHAFSHYFSLSSCLTDKDDLTYR